MFAAIPSLLALPVFLGLVAAAAVSDVRSYRIPNVVPLALALIFLSVQALAGHWETLPGVLAAGALALAFGWALQAGGVWGGGDAKLVAAIALWIGMADLPRFLLVTALAGGMLALWYLGRRCLAVRAGGVAAEQAEPRHLPYGLAIAVGGADWALWQVLVAYQ